MYTPVYVPGRTLTNQEQAVQYKYKLYEAEWDSTTNKWSHSFEIYM